MDEKAEKAKNLTSITIICIIALIGAIYTVSLIFLHKVQQLGPWYPPYMGFSVVIGGWFGVRIGSVLNY